jgi:hypothetical protein
MTGNSNEDLFPLSGAEFRVPLYAFMTRILTQVGLIIIIIIIIIITPWL